MSIEIKLTEDEALAYLETQTPDIATLTTALKTATEYIDALEAQLKSIQADKPAINNDDPMRHNIAGSMNKPAHHQKPSNRVLRDTEIAQEVEPAHAMANTKWTKEELNIIYWAMDRPETELNRKLENLLHKITRTEGAIRSKLNELGIKIDKGILYYE